MNKVSRSYSYSYNVPMTWTLMLVCLTQPYLLNAVQNGRFTEIINLPANCER